MKPHSKYLGICFVAFTTIQLYGQGYIVPNGVSDLGYNGYGYEIHVTQNPANGDYTGFLLSPITIRPPFLPDPNLFIVTLFLVNGGNGVRIFMVSLNDPISLQPILSNNYTELGSSGRDMPNGAPFYLGFYTGYSPQGGIYSNPVFGWGEFVNNAGAIQMLDSGLEIQGGGIYGGTQNIIPVPEPSVLGLFGIAVLIFAWHCNRPNTARGCVKSADANFGNDQIYDMRHFDETSRWMEWSKNEFSHRLSPEPTPTAS
jgi:hypothetical protein